MKIRSDTTAYSRWRMSLVILAGILCIGNVAYSQKNESLTALAEVAKANAFFAKNLYKVLREGLPAPGNLIFSPLSLSAVIAMVKGGARGKTALEIQNVLKFPDDTTLFSGYRSLLQSLKSNENFTLEIANRVYAKTGFQMNPDYTKIITDYFHAEVEQLDFAEQTEAAKKINGWVEKITRDKITNLISPSDLDASTRLVLINGIYFKGKWRKEFDPKLTQKAKFYLDSNNTVDVDMMSLETDLPYAEITELNAKAVSLPYLGDRLSMIILLPNDQNGLTQMESLLKDFDLTSLPARFRERRVDLQMPKFKLESTINLNDPLMKLGLTTMFDDGMADFSGIPENPNSEPLHVSKVIQKAFIEVNEEGSEAAAASGVLITLKSAIHVTTKPFTMDHPFVAHIYDKETQTFLFTTTVTNPLNEQTDLRSFRVLSDGGDNKDGSGVGRKPEIYGLLSLGILYVLQWAL